jgi:UDPglucose 6-dehydrogenase/UDP-N-acetyl-D-galactosamine dehydrogenase
MPKHVALMAIKGLNDAGKVIKGSKVLIMGLTYKENVPDTRESPVKEMIKELKEFGVDVYGYDPLLKAAHKKEFEIEIIKGIKRANVDCIIITVIHDMFKEITLDILKEDMSTKPVLIDVRGFFNPKEAKEKGFVYKNL